MACVWVSNRASQVPQSGPGVQVVRAAAQAGLSEPVACFTGS